MPKGPIPIAPCTYAQTNSYSRTPADRATLPRYLASDRCCDLSVQAGKANPNGQFLSISEAGKDQPTQRAPLARNMNTKRAKPGQGRYLVSRCDTFQVFVPLTRHSSSVSAINASLSECLAPPSFKICCISPKVIRFRMCGSTTPPSRNCVAPGDTCV